MAYNCVIVTGVTVSDYFCICMPTLSENEYKYLSETEVYLSELRGVLRNLRGEARRGGTSRLNPGGRSIYSSSVSNGVAAELAASSSAAEIGGSRFTADGFWANRR